MPAPEPQFGLCTVEQVTAYRQISADAQLIADLIDRATEKMLEKADREVISHDGETAAARLFDVTVGLLEDRELEIGDMAAEPSQIRILNLDGSVSEVVDLATVTALPRNRRETWRPITMLRFERCLPTSASLRRGQVVEVTALWGFPEVPPSLVQECIKTVHAWYLKDAGSLARSFKDGVQPSPSGLGIGQHELPLSAEQACERLRVPFG